MQEVEQTSHEESCVFARKVIASGDNNERGRKWYLRVSRVDKPCEETMRVGASKRSDDMPEIVEQ